MSLLSWSRPALYVAASSLVKSNQGVSAIAEVRAAARKAQSAFLSASQELVEHVLQHQFEDQKLSSHVTVVHSTNNKPMKTCDHSGCARYTSTKVKQ